MKKFNCNFNCTKKLIFLIFMLLFGISVCACDKNCDKNIEENNINNIIESVEVDCIFSIGNDCRPAHYLREHELRTQSAPLDWMMKYSLDTVITLFETKFESFFKNISEIPKKNSSNHRTVLDTVNNITSIHHFEKENSLEEEQSNFTNTMKIRATKTISTIEESSSIGLICDRNDETNESLIDFIKKFSVIFPDKQITLINIFDSDIEKNLNKKIILDDKNLKIIQYEFYDHVPSKSWKGNNYFWDKIVDNIKLKPKTITDQSSEKFVSNSETVSSQNITMSID